MFTFFCFRIYHLIFICMKNNCSSKVKKRFLPAVKKFSSRLTLMLCLTFCMFGRGQKKQPAMKSVIERSQHLAGSVSTDLGGVSVGHHCPL